MSGKKEGKGREERSKKDEGADRAMPSRRWQGTVTLMLASWRN